MPRKKRGSKVYEKALQRMAALKSINSNFDFGNGVNAVSYQQAIDDFKISLDDYNFILSAADEKQSVLDNREDFLNDMNERTLSGAASQYGRDSIEYDQAGGTRTRERKKPVARKKAS